MGFTGVITFITLLAGVAIYRARLGVSPNRPEILQKSCPSRVISTPSAWTLDTPENQQLEGPKMMGLGSHVSPLKKHGVILDICYRKFYYTHPFSCINANPN